MKRLFAVCSLLFLSVTCSSASSGVTGNPLEGFIALRTPVSDLPIGGQWNVKDEYAVAGGGLPPNFLRTVDSVTLQKDTDSKLSANIVATIASKLNLTFAGSKDVKQHVTLNKLTLVSVYGIENLYLRSDTTYLWSALKADSVSIHNVTSPSASVKIDTEKLFKEANVKVDASASGTSDVTITGGSLFVAIKAVKIGDAKTEVIYSNPSLNLIGPTLNAGTGYTIDLLDPPADPYVLSPWSAVAWPPPRVQTPSLCKTELRVTDVTAAILYGGEARHWIINCPGNLGTGQYLIAARPRDGKLVVDQLELHVTSPIDHYAPSGGGFVFTGGSLTITRRTFPMKTVH